jgi:hypothetical protein
MTFSVWRVALRKRGDLYGKRGGSQKKIQGKYFVKEQDSQKGFMEKQIFILIFLKREKI